MTNVCGTLKNVSKAFLDVYIMDRLNICIIYHLCIKVQHLEPES